MPEGYNRRMLSQYHIEIMLASLGGRFSPRAMSVITHANINQDRIAGQFGHDEYHFDNNAFDKSYAYIEEQRAFAISSLRSGNADAAWQAFGRLLHTAQDFYAHSNYVTLWLDQYDGAPPPPPEIEPLKKELIKSPSLRSGKIYFPLDALYFFKPLRPLILKFLPKDSHGWMNLDEPAQGPKFPYAISAATKRTAHEFDLLRKILTPEMLARFVDK